MRWSSTVRWRTQFCVQSSHGQDSPTGSTEDTSVCTVWNHARRKQIKSRQVIMSLRSACATIGRAHLCFDRSEIGTHSLGSGAAMKMYLAGVLVYTIMLIGRWSSNAFLCYIRKQVKQFLQDVSKKCWHIDCFERLQTLHLVWCIKQRSLAAQPSWQHQDEEKHWTRRVLTGAAPGFLPFQLTNRQCKRSN